MFLKILQIAIPFIWFGVVGAISFLEAPLKFRAPNVTLALGLGIGKIVFQALNRIEIVFAVLMLVSLFFARPAVENLEKDLHRHIHLENNILFPKAIAMEASGKPADANRMDDVKCGLDVSGASSLKR